MPCARHVPPVQSPVASGQATRRFRKGLAICFCERIRFCQAHRRVSGGLLPCSGVGVPSHAYSSVESAVSGNGGIREEQLSTLCSPFTVHRGLNLNSPMG